MKEHPNYQTSPEPDPDPDPTSGPTTDELIALARAHREGYVYPPPEELLRNLPRLLQAIADFVLSDEADVIHTAYAIASLIEVVEHVRETPSGALMVDLLINPNDWLSVTAL